MDKDLDFYAGLAVLLVLSVGLMALALAGVV